MIIPVNWSLQNTFDAIRQAAWVAFTLNDYQNQKKSQADMIIRILRVEKKTQMSTDIEEQKVSKVIDFSLVFYLIKKSLKRIEHM